MKDLLGPGEEFACEVFEGVSSFMTEEELANEGVKTKKGRLGRLIFEFTTADTLNRNRRIYPSEVFKLALDGLRERIDKNVVFGNLDHPSEWDPEWLIIKLSDAAVKVVEAKMVVDTKVKLTLDILANVHGQQLFSVLEAKGNPGVSQRAVAAWRDPTEAERERYKIPEGEFAIVAEALRLITYDVVSETGFLDADGARVTEHRTGDSPMLTKAQVKTDAPSVYAEIAAEGRAEALAEVKTQVESAVEERKPQIVEEALKPIQEELEAAKAENETMVKALEALKPLMTKLKIVNEKITDADAAARVATAEANVKTLQDEKTASEAANAELQKKVDAAEDVQHAAEALKAVSQHFADDPHHDTILKQVAQGRFTSTKKALEAAKRVSDFIRDLGLGKPKADEKNGTDADALPGVLEGLLHSNPANPANANHAESVKLADETTKNVHEILTVGLPTFN